MKASLTPGQAQTILRFMASVQLIGSDAPTFMQCLEVLGRIAKGATDEPTEPQREGPEKDPLSSRGKPNEGAKR
jgi:hypothetical protein